MKLDYRVPDPPKSNREKVRSVVVLIIILIVLVPFIFCGAFWLFIRFGSKLGQ